MGILNHFVSFKVDLSLKNPKQSPAPRIEDDLKVGLQTLVHLEPKQPPSPPYAPSIVHSYTVSTAWKPPPPPPSMFRSSVMDDVIGTESGDYMSSNVEDLKEEADKAEFHCNRSRPRYKSAKTREFPPPISLLAQTGGKPWVFKREIRIDGRLLIRAEKVKRHEYIEAHRQNGRLIMELVPALDDTVYCEDYGHLITDEELEEDEDVEGGSGKEEFWSDGSWLQKSPTKQETEESEDFRKCITYDDGLVPNSDSFLKGKAIEGPSGYLGRPGSTPLRPMTTVM